MRNLDCDVLVVGGGSAGFGAALAAARSGPSVRLIEAGPKIGGVMAACPGMPWGGGYPLGHSIGGVFEELTRRLADMQPAAAERRPCALENFGDEVHYDHEIAVATMVAMLEHEGVALHLDTIAGEPAMDAGRIAAVACHDRLGPMTVRAGMVIDCSGDGDVSVGAGVPYTVGDGRGNMMAVSLTFHMIEADCDRVFAEGDPYFRRHAAVGIAEGRLHPDLGKLYLMRGFHPNTVFCNTVTIRGVDGTDPAAVARATQQGRTRCIQVARFLIDDVPGFEQARMWNIGPSVGVRETRRMEALMQIRGDDLAAGRRFDDGVVACDNPIDDVMRTSAEMTHDASVGAGSYYTIPLRALVPRQITNLLFAGRLINADPVAFASVRGMPQCMAMGHAAGVTAALALAAGTAVQHVDPRTVVAALVAQGVRGIGGHPLAAPGPNALEGASRANMSPTRATEPT